MYFSNVYTHIFDNGQQLFFRSFLLWVLRICTKLGCVFLKMYTPTCDNSQQILFIYGAWLCISQKRIHPHLATVNNDCSFCLACLVFVSARALVVYFSNVYTHIVCNCTYPISFALSDRSTRPRSSVFGAGSRALLSVSGALPGAAVSAGLSHRRRAVLAAVRLPNAAS